MTIKKVWAVYFSPTGTTKRAVEKVADTISQKLQLPKKVFDFTSPAVRKEAVSFGEEDVVVFGVPVYAGRVPNVLLKYLDTVKGNGALAVPVVLFGNRNYDDALVELRDILENNGFKTIAAGAFVGEHSFSDTLAAGRPDKEDLILAERLGEQAAKKIESDIIVSPISVRGTPYPYSGYYQPRDREGNPVSILKVKPVTNDNCINCRICVKVCPMGSISFDDVSVVSGICIKCGACIKKCPMKAKKFTDAGFIYHKVELEEGLTRRGDSDIFF